MLLNFFTLLGMLMVDGFDLSDYKISKAMEPIPSDALNQNTYKFSNAVELIQFKGGPVMTDAVRIYFIFYGSWELTTIHKIEHLFRNFMSTDLFTILKAYKCPKGRYVTSLSLKQSITIPKYLGNTINDTSVLDIISTFYPVKDPNGIYFVLGDKNVKHILKPGVYASCEQFCGYHHINQGMKYIYIADSSSCDVCSRYNGWYKDIPNLDLSADATVNIMTHELFETITDPNPGSPAYMDANSWEV